MGRWHHSHRTDRNHEDSFDARTTAVTIQAQAQAPPRLPLDSSCFDTADIRPPSLPPSPFPSAAQCSACFPSRENPCLDGMRPFIPWLIHTQGSWCTQSLFWASNGRNRVKPRPGTPQSVQNRWTSDSKRPWQHRYLP
ncbi:hypothetical protein FALCPG4_013381 [Fusarium falciforme]